MKDRLRAIVFNPMDDEIEFWELESSDEQSAWDEIDQAKHNWDEPILLNEKKLRNLVKGLKARGWL